VPCAVAVHEKCAAFASTLAAGRVSPATPITYQHVKKVSGTGGPPFTETSTLVNAVVIEPRPNYQCIHASTRPLRWIQHAFGGWEASAASTASSASPLPLPLPSYMTLLIHHRVASHCIPSSAAPDTDTARPIVHVSVARASPPGAARSFLQAFGAARVARPRAHQPGRRGPRNNDVVVRCGGTSIRGARVCVCWRENCDV